MEMDFDIGGMQQGDLGGPVCREGPSTTDPLGENIVLPGILSNPSSTRKPEDP